MPQYSKADIIVSSLAKQILPAAQQGQEFFITPSWVMGNFNVSRSTADSVLLKLFFSLKESGLYLQRERGGLRIMKAPREVALNGAAAPQGKKIYYCPGCNASFLDRELARTHVRECPKV